MPPPIPPRRLAIPNAVDPRRSVPFRIYFWSNENLDARKPPHVHVESGDGYAEFRLSPVGVKRRGSYNATELERARRAVERFRVECLAAWERHHGSG